MTSKHKHMDIHDLTSIQYALDNGHSFKEIASLVGKDCTTISKFIRRNFSIRYTGAYGRHFNNCLLRSSCSVSSLCSSCPKKRGTLCRNCPDCRSYCPDFIVEICPLLSHPPYVCNACDKRRSCTLEKHILDAVDSHIAIRERLSEVHSGMIFSDDDISHLNSLLVPLIKDQGHSIHHVFIHHKDSIMVSEKTLYKAIDSGILDIRNLDLTCKVKLRPRRKKPSAHKVDRSCRINRTYQDYLNFMEEHPDTSVVQMDSVEGRKGGKVLLTLHFVQCSFMLIYIRDYNDAKSVKAIFHHLYQILGRSLFTKMFQVILTDNGSEFSDPSSIEFDENGEQRTHIFYCDPGRPDQKGACEVNHEFIRRILPKGSSFDNLNQKDLYQIASHINSYGRKKLNDRSPLRLFSLLYGEDIPSKLELHEVAPDDVFLSPQLLEKGLNSK